MDVAHLETGAALGRTLNGVYAVRSDCTGMATIFVPVPDAPFDIETTFVIVDGGNEVREAVMSPQPAMVTSLAPRM